MDRGVSVRTARKWESAGVLPSGSKAARPGRTRPNPFAGVTRRGEGTSDTRAWDLHRALIGPAEAKPEPLPQG